MTVGDTESRWGRKRGPRTRQSFVRTSQTGRAGRLLQADDASIGSLPSTPDEGVRTYFHVSAEEPCLLVAMSHESSRAVSIAVAEVEAKF